ncbi:MAG: rhomboid family intramembrane serine protease [Halodesulfurarchaeum sp.]
MDPLSGVTRLAVVLAALLAGGLVYSMRPEPGEAVTRLRRRLLFGLPIGTLLTLGIVASVFLFVQGGLRHDRLLTLPFISWSLRYPLGMVTAPLAHQSLSHLIGNLSGFLIFGSLCEYAVGHYPRERGRAAFDSIRTTPYARVLVVPGIALAVAPVTSLFAWGPIIGFSGVVYAAVGFSLIQFPVLAVIGLVSHEFVRTAFWALREPIVTESAGTSYGIPWWANVAVQTHLLGLLLGVSLGLAFWRLRGSRPRRDPWTVFTASLLVGSSLTLWAVWWYSGPGSYRLFRGPGFVLMLGIAVLVTIAACLRESPLEEVSTRQVSIGLILLPVLLLGAIALPINLTDPGEFGVSGRTVTVKNYEIGYAEGVPYPRIESVDVPVLNESETIAPTISGVIVANEQRHLFTEAVSAGRLATTGEATVVLGGLGWRETVVIERVGWRAIGGARTYLVRARTDSGVRPLYGSEPATAEAVVAGRTVTVAPANGTFLLRVRTANATAASPPPGWVPLPDRGRQITVEGLRITHTNGTLVVSRNDTRVPVFVATNRGYRSRSQTTR